MMKATQQERELILDMLASGKINTEEARGLFDAIEQYGDEHEIEDLSDKNDFVSEYLTDARFEIRHRMDFIHLPFAYTC